MKVKVIDDAQEKLVDASYILVDGVSLHEILNRLNQVESRLVNLTNLFNKKEETLLKVVKEL